MMTDNNKNSSEHNNRNKDKLGLQEPEVNTSFSKHLHSSLQNGLGSSSAIQSRNSDAGLTSEQEQDLVRFNHITYLLYVLSFFTAGLLWVVPIIMNYIRRHDAQGTWLATHFDWQIKTFWYSIVVGVIGGLMLLLSLGGLGISVFSESAGTAIGSIVMAIAGGFVLVLSVLWHIYRIVRGWIALTDSRPVQ